MRFEQVLQPGQLDRVQVGAVDGQVDQARAARFDQVGDAAHLLKRGRLSMMTASPAAKVAALDRPIVVLFAQDGSDQPLDGASLGKMPTTSMRR